MADTAVLESGTAAALEAPPEFASPETAPDTAPETDGLEETPVTEAEAEEPRYTAAELEAAREEAAKRERGNWEKWQQETADKAKREADEAAYYNGLNLASKEASENRKRYAMQNLYQLTKAAIDAGREMPDTQAIATIATQLEEAAAHGMRYQVHDQYATQQVMAMRELFPQYRPDQALALEGQRALAAFDYAGLARVNARMMAEAARQAVTAEAEAAVAAKTAQKPITKPAAGVTPTGGGLGAGPRMSNRQILDTEAPGSAAYRKAYRAVHGFDPD